jgi:hypothetical protein
MSGVSVQRVELSILPGKTNAHQPAVSMMGRSVPNGSHRAVSVTNRAQGSTLKTAVAATVTEL